ncbi:HNH endonuclease signature motif containing protein [Corynebacterium glaucum]|uniref:HNH endonuclease signature motif containing protein n=1 Tax=Corynebacterium glaucum TaxID=187491 RepID=UPI0031DB70C2
MEWAEGGETNIDNLIPLCSSCHSKVSHGLAEIRARGSAIEFSFIDGSRFLASVPRASGAGGVR